MPTSKASLMPGNSNYRKGVRFEYERLKHYKAQGLDAVRTAGSHGKWDIITIDATNNTVNLIQCKVTDDPKTAERLLRAFSAAPPLGKQLFNIHQTMEVKVTGSTEVRSVSI